MSRKTVQVASSVGLHARPAAAIARLAATFDTPITLQLGENDPVDAASTLMVMMMGAQHGDQIAVASEDQHAVDEVAALIASDLDAVEAEK